MNETSPPQRLAILHIGPMKTGSTSIQRWLGHNGKALEAHGVHVLRRSKLVNLSALAKLFQDGRPKKASSRPQSWVSMDTLTSLLDQMPASAHTCVISGEMFGQTMRAEGIKQLRSVLDPYFDSWKVVLYLRRQADLAVSRFSTQAKRGKHTTLVRPLNYAQMIDDWGTAFGRDALRPRLFARDELVDGDVVADFVTTSGLPSLVSRRQLGDVNVSLTADAQAFVERLTRHARKQQVEFAELPWWGELMRILERDHAGQGRLPSRAEAMAFMELARDSNERVRAEWFPERSSLFSSDYSKYPEGGTPQPAVKAELAVAMDLLLAIMRQQRSRDDDDESA